MPRERPITNWDEVPVIFDLPLASRIFGFSIESLKKKCQAGEFPAVKMGKEWRVEKNQAIKYFNSLYGANIQINTQSTNEQDSNNLSAVIYALTELTKNISALNERVSKIKI